MLEYGNTTKIIKNGMVMYGTGTSAANYGIGLHGSRTKDDACLILFHEEIPSCTPTRLYIEAYIQIDRGKINNYNTGW